MKTKRLQKRLNIEWKKTNAFSVSISHKTQAMDLAAERPEGRRIDLATSNANLPTAAAA